MVGIIPQPSAGSLIVRDGAGNPIPQPSVENGYVPVAAFQISCELRYLPSSCDAKVEPRQINAFQSELLCLAERWSPNGPWDCLNPCNLATAFDTFLAGDGFTNPVAGVLCGAPTSVLFSNAAKITFCNDAGDLETMTIPDFYTNIKASLCASPDGPGNEVDAAFIYCDGTGNFLKVNIEDFITTRVTAANTSVTPLDCMAATNVQEALEEICDMFAVTLTQSDIGVPGGVAGLDGAGNLVVPFGTKLYNRLNNEYWITDYTGQDGGVFNNDAAWLAAVAATPADCVIYFPKITDGVYNFTSTNDLKQRKIRGEGITLSGPGLLPTIEMTSAQGHVTLYNTVLKMPFDLFTDTRERQKVNFLSTGDLDRSKTVQLVSADFVGYSVAWPAGDTFTAAAPGITIAGDVITFAAATMTANAFSSALIPARYGSQYTFKLAADGTFTGSLGAIVRSETEFFVIYQIPNTGAFVARYKAAGQPAVNIPITGFLDGGTSAAYFMSNAHITVDLLDAYRFQIGINGTCIYDGRLVNPILEQGPASFPAGTGNGYGYYVHRVDNPLPLSPRPKRVLCVGDSLTDDINVGWPRDVRAVLQDSLGTQIEYFNNIAVAGETLSQQRVRVDALGPLTGYTDVFMMIGTNDIQGQTALASFQANMLYLLTLFAVNNNINVCVAMPPQYYTRALAVAHGGFGQNAVNYERGGIYRTIIGSIVGQLVNQNYKISFLDTGKVFGPISANQLDYNATGNEQDRNVMDNIHSTRRGRTKLAQWFGSACLGLVMPRRSRKLAAAPVPTTWQRGGWTFTGASGINAINSFGITEDGRKWLQITMAAGTLTADTPILKLPRMMYPDAGSATIRLAAISGIAAARVAIVGPGVATSGEVQHAGATAGNFLHFVTEYD